MRILNGLMGRPVTWPGLAGLPACSPSYDVYSQRRRADPAVFESLAAVVLYGSLVVAYDPYLAIVSDI